MPLLFTKHDTCDIKSSADRYVTPILLYHMLAREMVLSESSYCPACNSFFHSADTCPKTLPAYQPSSNVLIRPASSTSERYDTVDTTADLSLELQLRSIIADGIGNEGRRRDRHHRMHLQMLEEVPSNRRAREPIVLDYFDDSCVVTRSLLPICSSCVRAETGLEETALAPGLDMCRCATMLARAACPICVLGEINGALKYDVLKRTRPVADGSCEIACKCGNVVTAEGTARQCAYCRGIATAPLHGYGCQILEFDCGAGAPMLSSEGGSGDEKDQ